ncbi:MAG: hypothetical protein QOG18_1556, partial [Microbacteriaceae bacterium]|nr:hypothetical protein [Microbacteriaceae bacterium]
GRFGMPFPPAEDPPDFDDEQADEMSATKVNAMNDGVLKNFFTSSPRWRTMRARFLSLS